MSVEDDDDEAVDEVEDFSGDFGLSDVDGLSEDLSEDLSEEAAAVDLLSDLLSVR